MMTRASPRFVEYHQFLEKRLDKQEEEQRMAMEVSCFLPPLLLPLPQFISLFCLFSPHFAVRIYMHFAHLARQYRL